MLLTSFVHCPRFRRRNPRVLDALAATESICLCQLKSSYGKAKILSIVNSFKDVTMEPVNGVSLVSFVGVDMNDLTFFWMELHLPLSFQFLQIKKILLDRFCISITVDEFVQQAVVSKEARIGGFDRFREVVYECQEQQWTQNCSLWHSRDDISLLRSTPIQ